LEIVKKVTALPFGWKVSGFKTKKILRDVARGIVPDKIIHRPKAGFGAPYRKWLRYDLNAMWNELTSEASVRKRGWFDHKSPSGCSGSKPGRKRRSLHAPVGDSFD